MKSIFQTSQFKKDVKRLKKQGKDLNKLGTVIRNLTENGLLEERYKDHGLPGKWAGSRDCHIEPDWILIYRADDKSVFLERSGSHSDLFR
jgi:mRNA interferase YafQ